MDIKQDADDGIEDFNDFVNKLTEDSYFSRIEKILKNEVDYFDLLAALKIFEKYAPTYMNKSTFIGAYSLKKNILEEDLVEKIEGDVKEFFEKQAFKNTIEERCIQRLEGQKRAKVDVECIDSKEEHRTPIYEKNSNNEIIGGVGGIYASYQLTREKEKINVFIEQHYYYFPTVEKLRNALLEIKEIHQAHSEERKSSV